MPAAQVLPVACIIGCVVIYWAAEFALRRADPTGGFAVGLATTSVACKLRCLHDWQAWHCAAPTQAAGRLFGLRGSACPNAALRCFAHAGEQRALGAEAKGYVGWLMGLKLR